MGQDCQRELEDLSNAHKFYVDLLEKGLGHPVPVPAEVKKAADNQQDSGASETVPTLRYWLDLLDLATTPPLVRDALKVLPNLDTAHSLLRYYAAKASERAGDRDKTDCIVTHLFRNPVGNPAQWDRPEIDATYDAFSQAALAFEAELGRALSDVEAESITEDLDLLHEFEYLHQELEEVRQFDEIMDSGIVLRVRELKQSLGKSFYHPESLAMVAAWNDVFGRKFDVLFHDATKQIKSFAEHAQKEDGSILSRVDGDTTVQDLSQVETDELLAEEYQHAQEEFRKVFHYQKVVDNKA